jgi:hypothetical protein
MVSVREPMPILRPETQHGTRVSFWEDELRLDLEQERVLAALEGQDPDSAVTRYRSREYAWKRITCPAMEEQ